MVQVATSNRSALSFLLWSLVYAFEMQERYGRKENELIGAAIERLMEIDPSAMMEFFSPSWKAFDRDWMMDYEADVFAERLLGRASTLMSGLPVGKVEELLKHYARR